MNADPSTGPAPAPSIDPCVNRHCPWSGEPVDAGSLTTFEGTTVGFCTPACRDRFAADPYAFPEAVAVFRAAALARTRRAAGRPDWHLERTAIAAALDRERRPFVALYGRRGITIEFFAPRGVDTQEPHDRDEAYLIAAGHARFERAGETVEAAAGDFLFVPAFVPHRFSLMSADFATWVIFWGDPQTR